MLRSWLIGDIKVSSLVEYYGPTHDPEFLYPDFSRSAFEASVAEFPPGHYYPQSDRLAIAIQMWIVEAGDNVILIDAGVGNHKQRPGVERMHMLNTLVPAWLEAAGLPPKRFTHVVMTHMHSDHVGWNTVLDGDKWVPTFPNARYFLPKADFDYFNGEYQAGSGADGGAFPDSVLPIVEAGLVEFITNQREIADCLQVVQAPGHTPGQLNYWVRSKGETGVFSADIFHHITQIYQPTWNTAFCILPDQARATRAKFLAEAAKAEALVMPCHFAPPHCGYIRTQGDGYAFEPAPI